MKTLRWKRLALLCASLIAAPAWAGYLAYPTQLTTTRGSHSDQPIGVLAAADQSGAQDDWNKYKEFYTGGDGYQGVFLLSLPAGVQKADLTGIDLLTNFRGPGAATQRWVWQVWDFDAGVWVAAGDNQSAADWTWSALKFTLTGNPARFVDNTGQLKIRYRTTSSADNSDLDYLALDFAATAVTPPPPPPTSTVWHPAPGTSWQLQLQGTLDTSLAVDMYDIDLFDTPQATIDSLRAQGRKVICYFSAGSWENWRPDAASFPAAVKGRSNGWPGEKWLDIRRLDLLAPIMQARLDLAAQKHCDGVDPDNVDGYTNKTGFALGYQDQLTYNTWIANQAHARGLSVGLKNDLDQIPDLVPYFDWTLNEQCFSYNECNLLAPFIAAGKAVFNVEYQLDPAAFCPQANALSFDSLKKTLALDATRIDCHDYR